MTTIQRHLAATLVLLLLLPACGGGKNSNATDMGPTVDAGSVDGGDESDANATIGPSGGVVLVEGGFVTGGPNLSDGSNIRVLSQGFEVSGFDCSGEVCAAGGFVR